MQITLSEAILHIHPNSEFVIYGNNLKGLTFLNPSDLTVTQKQVDDAIKELEASRQSEIDNKQKQKAAILDRLGITEEEAKLLLA